MDSYDILNVSKDASDKEIEIAYKDLEKMYNPSFNTSVFAYKKYREIVKAYNNLKNQSRRKMYSFKEQEENKQEDQEKYILYDFESKEMLKDNENKLYDYVVNEEESIVEDIVIRRDISYLYYLLHLKCELVYEKRIIRNELKDDLVKCDFCNGKGILLKENKAIYCVVCKGKGKISKNYKIYEDEDYAFKEEKLSFYVYDNEMIFKGLWNEEIGKQNSLVKVIFNFYDKDDIVIKDDVIEVKYHLSEEETRCGLKKVFVGENSAFELELEAFCNNQEVREYNYENKMIRFIFDNKSYDGKDKKKFLLVNEKMRNKILYFNNDYSKCSLNVSEEYNNEYRCQDKFVIDSLGEKGLYEGEDGKLIIETIYTRDKNMRLISDAIEVDTSKVFNILGGKIDDGHYHFGFKGSNAFVMIDGNNYFLRGQGSLKRKLREYFVFKVLVMFLWVLIPSLIWIFLPYSESLFISLISVITFYGLMVSFVMEVKV